MGLMSSATGMHKRETVILIRDEIKNNVIRGTLITPNGIFQILERPWLNNKRNISCIPAGEYTAHFLKRSASGKYKNVYHVRGVEGRSGILIHNGNIVAHSKGCLIIGKRRGVLAGKPAVLNSRTALRGFVKAMNRQDFILIIIGNQEID